MKTVALSFYRPQRSWANVMFLQVCVILFTGGGCLPQRMLGYPPEQTPPRADTPWEQTPPRADIPLEQTPPPSRPPSRYLPPPEQTPTWSRHPPRADSLGADTPLPEQTPPPRADTPSWSRHPPPEADYGIRSTSGRYASYWNAFLFRSTVCVEFQFFDE